MAKKIFVNCISFLIFLLLSACATQYNEPQPLSASQVMARDNAQLVFMFLHRGYTDKAYDHLQTALQQAPDDPVILDTAGYYYEKIGVISVANRYYKQAVIVAPKSGITKNNYGAFLCRNGYYKESLPLFQAAAATPGTPIYSLAVKNEKYCNIQMQTKLGGKGTYAYYTH